MPKATVQRIFVQSLVGLAAGLVLLLLAGALAFANSDVTTRGPDVVGFRSSPFGWVMIALATVAALAILAALVFQFVAWIGAVVRTAALPDKTWFLVLLVTGLVGFGFVAMIVYLVAGPADLEATTAGTPPANTAAGAEVSANG